MAFAICLGVATLILLGGLLNVAHLATTGVVTVLACLGIGLALFFGHRNIASLRHLSLNEFSEQLDKTDAGRFLSFLCMVLSIFLIAYLLPGKVFNFHDDLHTYMPRLALMSQTGDIAQNPLGFVGLDSLGAQTFMQSFATGVFGLGYANGFDAVFCFVLSCMLLTAICKDLDANWIIAVAALTALITINLQQVNISATYSITALLLGIVYSGLQAGPAEEIDLKQSMPLVILLAALVSMKLMAALFATYFFVFYVANSVLVFRRVKNAFGLLVLLIATSLPWFLVHIEKYWTAMIKVLADPDSNTSFAVDLSSTFLGNPVESLFGQNELFWGGSLFAYNSLFSALVLLTLALFFVGQRYWLLKTVLLPFSFATTITYLTATLLFDVEMAIRYSLPFLIVASSIVLPLTGNLKQLDFFQYKDRANLISVGLAVMLLGFVTLWFYPSFDRRIDVAQKHHGVVMFPVSAQVASYVQEAMSVENKSKYDEYQSYCEAGSPVFVWVSAPFHFDFERNQIVYFAEAQTVTPWFSIPTESGASGVRSFFDESGIECVIWEYQGAGMKSINEYRQYRESAILSYRRVGEKVVPLFESLERLANDNSIVFNESGVVVFRLR